MISKFTKQKNIIKLHEYHTNSCIDCLQTAGVGREVNVKNQNNLNLGMGMGGGLGGSC
jgi:hypothetical protein